MIRFSRAFNVETSRRDWSRFFFFLSRSSTDYRVNFQRDVVRWSFIEDDRFDPILILYIWKRKREESNISRCFENGNENSNFQFDWTGVFVAHNSWKGKSDDHPDNDPPPESENAELGPLLEPITGTLFICTASSCHGYSMGLLEIHSRSLVFTSTGMTRDRE